MAGVFKSLDKSDIRVVPFRAHKQWVNDLSYTLTSTPSQSVTYAGSFLKYLQTNYNQSISAGNNYYYFVGEGGNIYQVDGNDNYALLTQTSNGPTIDFPFLSSAGHNQDVIMYYNSTLQTLCAHNASDLTGINVDSYTVNQGSPYVHLQWIPEALGGSPNGMVLLSGVESTPGYGLLSVAWDGSDLTTSAPYATNTGTNYLGTSFAVYKNLTDFFTAYVSQSTPSTMMFELKKEDGTVIKTSSVGSAVGYNPTAIKDFVSNGSATKLSAFLTLKGGTGLWFIDGSTSISGLPYTKYNLDVVRLLQDKDLYRNSSYSIARTFAVLRGGTVLMDLYADNTGYGWRDEIDVRRWIGSGEIIAATINKNVDLLSTTEPLKITIYAKTNQNTKAPIVVFSVNLDTQEVSDPIHLGFHLTGISSEPFLGDDGNTSVNFIGDNSAKKVVGLMYSSYFYDVATTNAYNKIYTFNI